MREGLQVGWLGSTHAEQRGSRAVCRGSCILAGAAPRMWQMRGGEGWTEGVEARDTEDQ